MLLVFCLIIVGCVVCVLCVGVGYVVRASEREDQWRLEVATLQSLQTASNQVATEVQ